MIQAEFEKMGIRIRPSVSSNSIVIDHIFPYCVDDDVVFQEWCLENAQEGACKSPQEVFAKIKESFQDVEMEGTIEIGDDNNRNDFYFHSPSGSREVTAEFALSGIPFSKCWLPHLEYSDYGTIAGGFASKEEFEKFIEDTSEFREEKGVDFDAFVHSDLLLAFLEDWDDEDGYSEESGAREYYDELRALYRSAWKKYQSESEND